MPLTVGTAGHVDHGKTWLVRALTGKDTDRLPEERRRGISIELGYAPLELPGGERLSLIDVPGHERFVRTMVAGATGVDLFLLVIDAKEGPRPQTREHLAILRLLGVDEGVVAVTKADAADPEPVLGEARELVPGADAIAVSAKSGLGLDELRAALRRAAARARPRATSGPTRLFVDRVFTLRGIGTVATGTLWSGSVGAGDELRAEPGGLDVRVRSVQVHDRPVERAEAGQRVAVALTGADRALLGRGLALVEPGAYAVSYRLVVELEELEPLPARVRAHHGTTETSGRIVHTDGLAQLRLSAPVVAARGDRVILRAGTTVAGAVVLDPAPRRERERPEPEPEPAAAPEPVDTSALAAELDAARGRPFRAADRRAAAQLEEEGRLVRLGDGFALEHDAYERARAVVVAECERAGTIRLARFRDLIGDSRRNAQLVLERLDGDGVTLRVGDERRLRRRRAG
jgi:selenocysteine-specific elongation factor